MADEGIHKQDFNVRNVKTRSVTLYPSRAHIVREIDDIRLEPGTNEITIYGLTPTADESSIKVEGKGSATITDMSVELVPNSENYETIYPESEESDSISDNDSIYDSENDEALLKSTEIKVLVQKREQLSDAIEKAASESRTSDAQLAMLKLYGESIGRERPAAKELSDILTTYKIERTRAHEDLAASDSRLKGLRKQRDSIEKVLAEAKRPIRKANKIKEALKVKEYEQRQRARDERKRAIRHLKDEREQFWPRKVYRAVVTLETYTFTPASSRRGSIDTTIGNSSHEESSSSACDIHLSISYIISGACWAPRYELSLNTINSTGLITYRAEFCNTTSETWSDTKVILSTSHTAFQGLGDAVPTIVPWHIKLSKKTVETSDSTSAILYSDYERTHRHSNNNTKVAKANEPRATLFGVGSIKQNGIYTPLGKRDSELQNDVYAQTQEIRRAIAAIQQSRSDAQTMSQNRFDAVGGPAEGDEAEDMGFGLFDDEPTNNIPELPSLEHQESSWSESGLTATYDLPGTRTIAPSPTTRRQKIASISLRDASLSYHLVPKLRAAAFLKARLHNTSSITLLKGPCGLTLDGSFLGNTHLPRCSAGDRFSLSLGVDPSVNVSYSKPVVRRSQTGFLQREGSGIFTRTCTITNTKSDRIVEGVVIDQIPVSEDERLRVDILEPAGLHSEGSTTYCSAGITADGKADSKAADTLVTLKRGGFVRWDIQIKPGRGLKLELEYEARFPSTELAVGADEVAEESEDEAFGLFD